MSMIDKTALLAPRLPTKQVAIVGIGAVTVRALSREEMLQVGSGDVPALEFERRALALALVDPELTEDEVAQWQRVSPAAEMQEIMATVNELSGIGPASQKEAYKSVRKQQRR
jgi:hypothetical protein